MGAEQRACQLPKWRKRPIKRPRDALRVGSLTVFGHKSANRRRPGGKSGALARHSAYINGMDLEY
jgi:hypothetical protein